MFWGFIITSGILVAQLSTKLSDWFAQNEVDALENSAEADEAAEPDAEEESSENGEEAVIPSEVIPSEVIPSEDSGAGSGELSSGL
jgi:hypothetical protein